MRRRFSLQKSPVQTFLLVGYKVRQLELQSEEQWSHTGPDWVIVPVHHRDGVATHTHTQYSSAAQGAFHFGLGFFQGLNL